VSVVAPTTTASSVSSNLTRVLGAANADQRGTQFVDSDAEVVGVVD
jgi:hypothetical protein